MQSMMRLLFELFLSTGGLAVLAALESTLFFWFPFGIDAAVVILAVRNPDKAWLYPILASAGSLIGAAATYWMGGKLGEAGLDRHISARRLESVKARIRDKGAIAIASLGAIPPPFPFTAFVLVSGAFDVPRPAFFATLGAIRLLRFGAEAALAMKYGTSILRWFDSPIVQAIVVCFILLAVVGSAVSLYALLRRRPQKKRARRKAGAD